MPFLFHTKNLILDEPYRYAQNFMIDSSMDLLSGKILLLTDETGIEYIFDFMDKYGELLELGKSVDKYNIQNFKEKLHERYHLIDKMPTTVIRGHHEISLTTLYSAVIYLANKGYKVINRPYPKMNILAYKETPIEKANKYAFMKFKALYTVIENLFQVNVISHFPGLIDTISLFKGYQLLVVDLSNTGVIGDFYNFRIRLYYFKIDNTDNRSLIISNNFDSNFFYINGVSSEEDLIERCWGKDESLTFSNYSAKLIEIDNEASNSFRSNNYINSEICGLLKNRIMSIKESK